MCAPDGHPECPPWTDKIRGLSALQKGKITIGGADIREMPLPWLRRHVGMVLQEPFLCSRTIRDIIAAAAPKASMEEIRQADLILVVKDGKIIRQGNHQELLCRKGSYYELYSRQFEEEAAMKVFGSGT